MLPIGMASERRAWRIAEAIGEGKTIEGIHDAETPKDLQAAGESLTIHS
jgi:hypothetical protein